MKPAPRLFMFFGFFLSYRGVWKGRSGLRDGLFGLRDDQCGLRGDVRDGQTGPPGWAVGAGGWAATVGAMAFSECPTAEPDPIRDPTGMVVGFYDRRARQYAETWHEDDSVDRQRTQFLTGVEAGAPILDAGCGTGRDTLMFAQTGHVAVGMDLSDGKLNIAAEQSAEPITSSW